MTRAKKRSRRTPKLLSYWDKLCVCGHTRAAHDYSELAADGHPCFTFRDKKHKVKCFCRKFDKGPGLLSGAVSAKAAR